MAKFKVGDKVTFKEEGWRGVIQSVRPDGSYGVRFNDGTEDRFREDQLVSNSCLNAKFKVGDKVKIRPGQGFYSGLGATVIGFKFNHTVVVRFSDGDEHNFNDFELEPVLNSAANSSNPVVANAVAWKAKNAVCNMERIRSLDAYEPRFFVKTPYKKSSWKEDDVDITSILWQIDEKPSSPGFHNRSKSSWVVETIDHGKHEFFDFGESQTDASYFFRGSQGI